MKERCITLALAIGAFLLFYALFVPKPAPDNKAPALPVSTETKPSGYQALWRWLQAEQIPVVSFRERYLHLARRAPSATGNVLIATLPQQLPARPDELTELDQWIEQGNTLVVMAALDDTPEWALRSGQDLQLILQRMTRLKFLTAEQLAKQADNATESTDEATEATNKSSEASSETSSAASIGQTIQQAFERLLNPERSDIAPHGMHPLLAGVQSVATISEYPASHWYAKTTDASALLILADRTGGDTAEPALWLKRYGRGQIIICAFATPFSNQLIGASDNARLFTNILTWSRSNQGAVLFDDTHQGLVSYYDAKAFFADPRLHRTLIWIVLLWLLLVLGWQRFRPQFDTWNPVDVTTFIKVTGGFFAGSLTVNATGQRLFENFFNHFRRRVGQPENGQPIWEWLAMQAGVSASQLVELKHLHANAHSGKQLDLIQLQNRLTILMRHLA